MSSKCVFLLALVAVVAASAAGAKENYHEKTVNADTKEKFVEIATNVRQEMEGGGRYEYVKPDERKTIDQKFTEMEADHHNTRQFMDDRSTVVQKKAPGG